MVAKRTTEKRYYVVCKADKGNLWLHNIVIGRTPCGYDQKSILGIPPLMAARELCDYFGVEFSTVYSDRSHLETRINRKIKDVAFYGAIAKENAVALRLAIDSRICNRCKRPVVKSLVAGYPFECLHCDESLMSTETTELKGQRK